MIQQLETTLREGAVPQPPQFRTVAPATRNTPSGITSVGRPRSNAAVTPNTQETTSPEPQQLTNAAEKPCEAGKARSGGKGKEAEEPSSEAPVGKGADPLGDARSRVQEEITREFAAIMASGTLRASEAAALATRRVMQRYGGLNVSAAQ